MSDTSTPHLTELQKAELLLQHMEQWVIKEGSALKSWLESETKKIIEAAGKVAVFITQHVNVALANGTLGVFATLTDAITRSNIGTEAKDALAKWCPRILALCVGIQNYPQPGATADQVLAWENSILSAFNVIDNKSIVYESFAAQVYGILNSFFQQPGIPKLSAWLPIVSEIYNDWQIAKANIAAGTAPAPLG